MTQTVRRTAACKVQGDGRDETPFIPAVSSYVPHCEMLEFDIKTMTCRVQIEVSEVLFMQLENAGIIW